MTSNLLDFHLQHHETNYGENEAWKKRDAITRDIDDAQDNLLSNREQEYTLGEKFKMFLAKGCCFGLCFWLSKKKRLSCI